MSVGRVSGGLVPSTRKLSLVLDAYNLSTWETEQEDQEFKVILDYETPSLPKTN